MSDANNWIDPDADKDFRTVVPPAVWDEYFREFGRLMHFYARMEVSMNVLVSSYVEMKVHDRELAVRDNPAGGRLGEQRDAFLSLQRNAVLRAMIGGLSTEGLKDAIVRLLRVTGEPAAIIEKVKQLFSHLTEIQRMRNRLAHSSATPDLCNKDSWFYTDNQYSVREAEKAEMIYFQASVLRAMANDVERMPRMLERVFHPQLRKIADEQARQRIVVENEPWEYDASTLRRTPSM
jgi:hypothetical protein